MLVSLPPVFTTLPAPSGKEKKNPPKQTRKRKKKRTETSLHSGFYSLSGHAENLSTQGHWQTCRWKGFCFERSNKKTYCHQSLQYLSPKTQRLIETVSRNQCMIYQNVLERTVNFHSFYCLHKSKELRD